MENSMKTLKIALKIVLMYIKRFLSIHANYINLTLVKLHHILFFLNSVWFTEFSDGRMQDAKRPKRMLTEEAKKKTSKYTCTSVRIYDLNLYQLLRNIASMGHCVLSKLLTPDYISCIVHILFKLRWPLVEVRTSRLVTNALHNTKFWHICHHSQSIQTFLGLTQTENE